MENGRWKMANNKRSVNQQQLTNGACQKKKESGKLNRLQERKMDGKGKGSSRA